MFTFTQEKREAIIDYALKRKKGVLTNITFRSEVNKNIIKVSNAIIVMGINYKNKKVVKEKYKDLTTHDFKLPWGYFKIENYIIAHTNKQGEYKEYLRCYSTKHIPKVKYYYNGEEVSRDYILKNGLATAKQMEAKKPICFNVELSNILRLGTYYA
jgi:hypothetical protein